MDDTINLKLPYILAAQSQKHVTHNEALRMLDTLVQPAVADKDLTAPPGSPVEGGRYLVAAGATGAWAGQVGKIAAFQDGAWAFYAPLEGWLVWVADENVLYAFDGTSWTVNPAGSVNPVALVGVNATADATNRLSVSSDASLFNHDGSGHQVKVNKAAAGNTASLLFQTAFSGRAEFGLAGDDDFHVKVSPDGSAWHEALVIDRSNGAVRAKVGRVDVASAATCDIGSAAAQRVRITGTTTISSFGTVANEMRLVLFDGALTLTHNGTSLILPGAANIVTAAGDSGVFASDGSGNWRCIGYQRANGHTLNASAFIATLLDDSSAATARATLGARVRFEASVSIADDAAASFSIGTGTLATIIAFSGSVVTQPYGFVMARAAATSNGTAELLAGGSARNYYATALTGTTGADGSLNFGADTAGSFYVENRRGVTTNLRFWVFE